MAVLMKVKLFLYVPAVQKYLGGIYMNRLYYCKDCRRVTKGESNCEYCSSNFVNELAIGTPVNVIGSKLKGNVLKIKDGEARLLIRDDSNNKFVKEYKAEEIRKIL